MHVQLKGGVLVAISSINARENQAALAGVIFLEELLEVGDSLPSVLEDCPAARMIFRGVLRSGLQPSVLIGDREIEVSHNDGESRLGREDSSGDRQHVGFSLKFRIGAQVADPDVKVAHLTSEFETTNAAFDNFFPDRGSGSEEGEEGVGYQKADTRAALIPM
jgi:hypothetical protein